MVRTPWLDTSGACSGVMCGVLLWWTSRAVYASGYAAVMPTERSGTEPPGSREEASAGSSRSDDGQADRPLTDSGTVGSSDHPPPGSEAERLGAGSQDRSRLANAVTFGVAGATGGGVAGTMVGWGGIGVAAAGGAVGFPVVVPVAVGAAAGVGVVVAAKALRGPVARASSAVREKFADAEREATAGGPSIEAEADSVGNGEAKGTKSGAFRAAAAASAAGATGAAAVVAGGARIRRLRRRIFKNAKPDHIRVPPNARSSLYENQQGFCNGCGNWYEPKDLGLDHIVPRAKGGTNKIENLQLLCHHCNAVKGTRSWESFIKSIRDRGPDTEPV